MAYIGNAPAAGIVDSGNILNGAIKTEDLADAAVTAAKLAAAAITEKLGYTPLNKAGDTINGDLVVNGVLSRVDSSNNVGWQIVTTSGRTYMVLDSDASDGVGSGGDYLYLGSDGLNFHNAFSTSNNDTQVKHRRFRCLHAEGGEWAILGSAYKATGTYLHIKTNLSKHSYKMVGFRMSGFYPYNTYGHGFLGCYTYGDNHGNHATEPYGIVVHNAGMGINVADGMYHSSDGYVVLRLYWPTSYNGVLIEYMGNGSAYGNQSDIQMLAYTGSNSVTGVY